MITIKKLLFLILILTPSIAMPYEWVKVEEVGDGVLDVTVDRDNTVWVTGHRGTWYKTNNDQSFIQIFHQEIDPVTGQPVTGQNVPIKGRRIVRDRFYSAIDPRLWLVDLGFNLVYLDSTNQENIYKLDTLKQFKHVTDIASGVDGLWAFDLKDGLFYSENFQPNPILPDRWEKINIEVPVARMDYSIADNTLWVSKALVLDASITPILNAHDSDSAEVGTDIIIPTGFSTRGSDVLDLDIDQGSNSIWLAVNNRSSDIDEKGVLLYKADRSVFNPVNITMFRRGLESVAIASDDNPYIVTKEIFSKPGELFKGIPPPKCPDDNDPRCPAEPKKCPDGTDPPCDKPPKCPDDNDPRCPAEPPKCTKTGKKCELKPSECFGTPPSWMVEGVYQCVNDEDVCRVSSDSYCEVTGSGGCGASFGHSCSSDSDCGPALGCGPFFTCELSGCSLPNGFCWKPGRDGIAEASLSCRPQN